MTPTESSPSLTTNRWFLLPAHGLIPTLWQARLLIARRTALFILAGILVALLKQPEFLSEARLMPEMNTGAADVLKKLSSVAGFTGIDLSEVDDTDAVRPDLYPNVLQSTPFVLYLIDQIIRTTDGQRKTVSQLLLPDQPSWLISKWWFFPNMNQTKRWSQHGPNEPVQLSEHQYELADAINERVNAKFDTRSGLITITATLPDAQAAADVTQLAMSYLTQYVINYRTEKARQDLKFYHQQVTQAQQRYQNAQVSLFRYNDNHKALALQSATLERHRLETEWQLAQTLYTELSRQYEQAKINVQQRTPVFKVLEPPRVPLKRSAPKRVVIVALFTLTGFVINGLFILIRQPGIAGQVRAMVDGKS